jgi:hypothetical protein
VASRAGFHAGFLFGIFYDPEDRGDMFLGKNGQYGVISQKITTAVRTSDPTNPEFIGPSPGFYPCRVTQTQKNADTFTCAQVGFETKIQVSGG